MDGVRDSSNDYEGTLVVSPETETEYWYPVKVVSATYCEPRTFSLTTTELVCSDLFYSANHSSNPSTPLLLSLRHFGEARSAIPGTALELRAECEIQKQSQ